MPPIAKFATAIALALLHPALGAGFVLYWAISLMEGKGE